MTAYYAMYVMILRFMITYIPEEQVLFLLAFSSPEKAWLCEGGAGGGGGGGVPAHTCAHCLIYACAHNFDGCDARSTKDSACFSFSNVSF